MVSLELARHSWLRQLQTRPAPPSSVLLAQNSSKSEQEGGKATYFLLGFLALSLSLSLSLSLPV
jgi:hypothetical protein